MAENIVEVVLRVNADQFKNGIQNATRVYAQSTKNMTGASGQAVGGVQNLTSTVLRLGAAYISVSQSIRLVKTLLETGGNFEQLRVQLETLTGSAQAGEAAFAWINDFVKETPFGLEDVTKGFIKLKAFGLDPMDGTYQVIADQAAALGGGQEKLNGIIIAVGQAWAKQKLQAEEILQLVERGVPVWDLLAKVTGKNAAELNKLSEQGKLGRDVIRDLVKEMGKGVDGAALDQVKTWNGLVSNAGVEWQKFLDTIAQSGALDFFKDELTELLTEVERLAESGELQLYAQDVGEAVVGLVKGLQTVVGLIASFSGEIKLLLEFLLVSKLIQWSQALYGVAAATLAVEVATTKLTRAQKLLKASATFGLTLILDAVIRKFVAMGDATEEAAKSIEKGADKITKAEAELKEKTSKALTEAARAHSKFAKEIKLAKDSETLAIQTALAKQLKLYDEHIKGLKDAQKKQKDIAKEFADFVNEIGGGGKKTIEAPDLIDFSSAITNAKSLLNEGDFDGALEGARGLAEMIRKMQENGTEADVVLKGLAKRTEALANEAAAKQVDNEAAKLESAQKQIDDLVGRAEFLKRIEIGFDNDLAAKNADELRALLQQKLADNPIVMPVVVKQLNLKPAAKLLEEAGSSNPLIPLVPQLPDNTTPIRRKVELDTSLAEKQLDDLQKKAEQPAVKPVKTIYTDGNSFSDGASSFGEGDVRLEALARGKRR